MKPASARSMVIVVIGSFVGVACTSSPVLDSLGVGTSESYVQGYPNFDIEARALWHEETPEVEVYLNVPMASLVFLRTDQGFRASYEAAVLVFERESNDLRYEQIWTEEVTVATYGETQQHQPRSTTRRLNVEPGEYVLAAKVLDLNSNKYLVRRQAISVRDVKGSTSPVSSLHIESKRSDGTFRPVDGVHLASNLDSLRSLVRLYNPQSDRRVEVKFVLLRNEMDTTVPRPPYTFSSFTSAFARGFEYDRSDTVLSKTFLMSNLRKDTNVTLVFPGLERGIYAALLEVRGAGASGSEDDISRDRKVFFIMGRAYPKPVTLKELVEPMAYIAREEEMERIVSAPTPELMRNRFDEFWLSLAKSSQAASNLIKQFYTRVELANRYFGAEREGWRTDRGMIYIVFGSPITKETRPDYEIWRYTYAENDPSGIFAFQRIRSGDDSPFFEGHILVRQSFYDRVWERAVQRWRSGAIF